MSSLPETHRTLDPKGKQFSHKFPTLGVSDNGTLGRPAHADNPNHAFSGWAELRGPHPPTYLVICREGPGSRSRKKAEKSS